MSTQGQDATGHSPNGEDTYRRLTEEWNAAFNAHDAEKFASYYAEDAMVTDPMYPQSLRGREAVQQDITEFMGALPDVVSDLQQMLVDGATVATHGAMTGTQTGPMPTPSGEIPPTGRPVKVPMGVFRRFGADGKVAEEHRYYDVAGLAAQPEVH